MIRLLKIITGEEIIADVTAESGGTSITLKTPCVIQLVRSDKSPDGVSMGMLPYAPYTKDHSVTLARSQVVWSEEPVEELYNQYNRLFGTGIVVPTQQQSPGTVFHHRV